MKKMARRFVALVVVFVSIISFLPIKLGLNGQAANAITTQIQVNGDSLQGGDEITITNGEYATLQPYKNFTISVENKIVDNIDNIGIGQTGVTAQEIIIKSIDGIKLDGLDLNANNIKLSEIGCSISAGTILYTDENGKKTIGITITGLPYGVNKIEYQIKETTVFNKGKTSTDATGKTTIISDLQPEVNNYYPSLETTKEIVIQHANKFVQKKINPMVFDSYVGDIREYNENDTSNKVPFLFSEDGKYNENCPLRYNFNVSDAISTLKYTMNFDSTVPIDDLTRVFKNGTVDSSITIDQKSISGYLKDLGGSDLIVVKLSDNDTNVSKAYSIQLEYTTLPSPEDYTLRDAGITKLNYNVDSNVKAYVGKKFDVKIENGVITYNGTITLDKMAEKISMQPTLGRSSSNTAFKISNHYDGKILDSRLINGKQYVNFAAGTSNEIWLEVYEGKDGNVTGALLAIYKLKVNLIGSVDSTVKFSFLDSILTQPGRTIDDKIDFDANRRTYDLYFEDDSNNNMSVTLEKPYTTDENTKRREYIKAWGGTSVQSDNVTEIKNLGKEITASIDISNYKKIILQAYYDQIVYKKDEEGNVTAEEESRTSHPIGQKYTFYIAKNAGIPDVGDTTSSNASLSDIQVDNGNIESTDGTSGFSTDKTNYNVKVPKIDTSAKIIVTASDSNVKDITATIVETGDEYGLNSGESFDFPLNSTGTTNIKIVVTAEDGITSKTYNITVSNDARSASALLKNVIIDNGDFTFDSNNDVTKVRVDQNVNSIKVTPLPEDSKANITVNGEEFSSSPITINLKGSQKTEINIEVVSEDGTASKTYTLEIYRVNAADWEDDYEDGDDPTEDDQFYDEYNECWVNLTKYDQWGSINGKSAYFDKKSRQVKEAWISTGGKYYYLNNLGYRASGWKIDATDGKTYYLDTTTGEMKKGWINLNNSWYYLGLNGVMHKGWLSLNQKWYYFTSNGQMVINQTMYVDGKVYKFGQDGAIY